MPLGKFKSWPVVFDTEYIVNQKMVQINAFELSFNLQYQPTLYIAWLSCNLQKYIADFREITPNRANAWCSALWGQLPLTGFHEVHAFCLSFLLFKQLQKLLYDTLEWGRETKHKKRKKKSHDNMSITWHKLLVTWSFLYYGLKFSDLKKYESGHGHLWVGLLLWLSY